MPSALGLVKAGCAAAAAAACLAVLVILVIYFATPHRCFLDVLNAQIVKQCKPGTANEFRPLYARSDGALGLPTPGEVVPGLERLDRNYAVIRAEMEAAIFGAEEPAETGAENSDKSNEEKSNEDKSNEEKSPENLTGKPAENLVDLDRLPAMHEVYNNIFLYKGSKAGRRKAPAVVRGAQRLFTSLVYGKDADIFDKIGSPKWRTFNLLLFNHPVPGNAEKCPRTVKLLQGIPGVQSALFSVIKPGAYIPPHSDPAKGVIRYHLALRIPRDRPSCFIEVNCAEGRGCAHTARDTDCRYSWTEGQSVLFDDVFPHWAQNDTDEVRVILFVDILRPLTGTAHLLQKVANATNFYHPGVRRLVAESRVGE